MGAIFAGVRQAPGRELDVLRAIFVRWKAAVKTFFAERCKICCAKWARLGVTAVDRVPLKINTDLGAGWLTVVDKHS